VPWAADASCSDAEERRQGAGVLSRLRGWALVRTGSPAEGTRIRTCMGLLPVKWCFSVYCQFFVRSGKGPFFIPSPTIRFPERMEWGQGTETLAKAWRLCRLAALVFRSALTPEYAEGR
jgi:hypothetical protein